MPTAAIAKTYLFANGTEIADNILHLNQNCDRVKPNVY